MSSDSPYLQEPHGPRRPDEHITVKRRRDDEARNQHRNWYWRKHDRETYVCPRCERSSDEVDQLDVHHIDHNPRNGDPENLVALCRRCHYEVHGRSQPQTLEEWKSGFLALGQ